MPPPPAGSWSCPTERSESLLPSMLGYVLISLAFRVSGLAFICWASFLVYVVTLSSSAVEFLWEMLAFGYGLSEAGPLAESNSSVH